MTRPAQGGSEEFIRKYDLPADVTCYWQSGRLDHGSLPVGLTREHRLKEGTWGVLSVRSGAVKFVWDDSDGGTVELAAPGRMIVPPTVPHHVVLGGPFTLEIEFYRRP